MRITSRILSIASVATVTSTLFIAGVTEARGPGDTIANVAAAGKNASAIADPAQVAMADAANVMRRMASDVEFQKSVLAFANKNDIAGLTGFLQKAAPNSTVTVDKVQDFSISLKFTVKGHKVSVCASDESACGGHSASLAID